MTDSDSMINRFQVSILISVIESQHKCICDLWYTFIFRELVHDDAAKLLPQYKHGDRDDGAHNDGQLYVVPRLLPVRLDIR